MAWIDPTDVTDVYPSATVTADLVAHVQGLAEVEIGDQTEPVSSKLAAVMVQIVHRFSLAAAGDDNISQEALGPYSYTRATVSGLGLTKTEKRLLKKAAGQSTFWVQPITRSAEGKGLETAGPLAAGDDWLEGAL